MNIGEKQFSLSAWSVKKQIPIRVVLAMVSLAAMPWAHTAAAENVAVGDAYVRSEANGTRWVIGTQGVEQTFDGANGRFLLSSYRNKLTQPATEYVARGTACTPFGLDVGAFVGQSSFQDVWSKTLAPQATADPADDKLTIDVKEGDLIGFCVSRAGSSLSFDNVAWTSKIAYVDGPSFASSDDAKLDQGPVWFYYERATGSGSLQALDEACQMNFGGGAALSRVATGYRAPPESQGVSATHFGVRNFNTLIRAWKAPQSGKVTIGGPAKLLASSSVQISIARISQSTDGPRAVPQDFNAWKLQDAKGSQVNAGGRPAAQLEITLARDGILARLRIVAYPGTPVLRQWVTLENTGSAAIRLKSPSPLVLSMDGKDTASYTHSWLCGGTSRPNQGMLEQSPVTANYHRSLLGEETDNFVPWTALHRKDGAADGCFAALDFLSTWNLSVDRAPHGPTLLSVSLPPLANYSLAPGKPLELPVATIGVFHRDLDDMGVHLYNWQYEYLWDYTNPDYYAKTKWAVQIFYCSRNLQEQFAARLGWLDMDIDLMRTLGIEMLWDDAGWAKYPSWPIPDSYSTFFTSSVEGPDFAETLRYLGKMDMHWLLWMCGRPPLGVLNSKIGAWGNFQWRTDGVGRFDPHSDRGLKKTIKDFLDQHPRASFHTCDGGSRYAHQFEIQRLADVNYLSDGGRGDQVHHYFSYLEAPDRWLDHIEVILRGCKYSSDTAFGQLATAPTWYALNLEPDRESLRRLMETYRYLRREGVAGRWSYTMHPIVQGDAEYFYDERISRDRTKACIILKHRAESEVTVYPRGLLPQQSYEVAFELNGDAFARTGDDLMTHGIVLKKSPAPVGVIYLGLPDRPRSQHDTTAPNAPGRVLARREVNIGHPGVGLYWSAGSDNNWISYYEVRRGDQMIGKASIGTYYFDHAPGWDVNASYSVRTVDGDGNASDWIAAQPLPGGPDTYAALGGHFSEAGRDGWKAEETQNGRDFTALTWVPPARMPGADFGGTPNQVGGVEGYWEGKSGARVGRGWQQAASDAACVRTWIAARPGQVRIVGRVMKEYYHQPLGTGLRAHIVLNDRVVWPESGEWADVPLKDLYGAAHDFSRDVKAGDALRFVVNSCEDRENALVAWMPRIVYADSAPAGAPGNVVRILCGAQKPYTDHDGNVWSADQFYSGGTPMTTTTPIAETLPTAADQTLYQSGREGKDFSYSIPVKPGLYTIRLKFAEPKHEWFFERPFNVSVNGCRMMSDTDICHVARGPRKAYEKVLRYLVPAADGKLTLRFTSGSDPLKKSDLAMIQAIEVLPEIKPTIRIDCGSETSFIDWNSFLWDADRNAEGGTVLTSQEPVAQASPTVYDQRLYQTARTGKDIGYTISVPPGLYTVHLKFAELWLAAPGERPMDIEINGRRVRQHWDPATAAGQRGMAADVRMDDIAPNAAGQIVIHVRAAGANNAIIQGLEIE